MKTPALDRFAREGTAFRQYYVTGCTCNPSRTGLMTGQLPARFQKYPADHGFGGAMTITERLAERADAWNRTLPKSYEKSAGKEEQE